MIAHLLNSGKSTVSVGMTVHDVSIMLSGGAGCVFWKGNWNVHQLLSRKRFRKRPGV